MRQAAAAGGEEMTNELPCAHPAREIARHGVSETGFTMVEQTWSAKWLELLKQVAPGHGPKGSAVPMIPQSVSRGARIPGLLWFATRRALCGSCATLEKTRDISED
jgi:hypothetical protein